MKHINKFLAILIASIIAGSFAAWTKVDNDVKSNGKGTFTDSRDGKVYKTVTIGNQVWMAENLAIKDFIVMTVQNRKEISLYELTDIAVDELTQNFDGKVLLVHSNRKLDLEAREIIERIPKTSPHKLQIKNKLVNKTINPLKLWLTK